MATSRSVAPCFNSDIYACWHSRPSTASPLISVMWQQRQPAWPSLTQLPSIAHALVHSCLPTSLQCDTVSVFARGECCPHRRCCLCAAGFCRCCPAGWYAGWRTWMLACRVSATSLHVAVVVPMQMCATLAVIALQVTFSGGTASSRVSSLSTRVSTPPPTQSSQCTATTRTSK